MLPYMWMVASRYVPFVMFPVAVVIGVVGYNLETRVLGPRRTPSQGKSIEELRQNRLVNELTESDPTKVDALKDNQYQRGYVFTKNLSPSLEKP